MTSLLTTFYLSYTLVLLQGEPPNTPEIRWGVAPYPQSLALCALCSDLLSFYDFLNLSGSTVFRVIGTLDTMPLIAVFHGWNAQAGAGEAENCLAFRVHADDMVTMIVLKIGQFAARTLRIGASGAGILLLSFLFHRGKSRSIACGTFSRACREAFSYCLFDLRELAGLGVVIGSPERMAGYALINLAFGTRKVDLLLLNVIHVVTLALTAFELFMCLHGNVELVLVIHFCTDQVSLACEVHCTDLFLASSYGTLYTSALVLSDDHVNVLLYGISETCVMETVQTAACTYLSHVRN